MSLKTRQFLLPLPDDVRDQWRQLESAAEHPSVFRTPEWIEARTEALGLTDDTVIYVWEVAGRVVAVLPVTATRERLHPRIPVSVPVLTTAGAGTGAADHTGWSAADGADENAVAWLRATRRTVVLRNLDPRLASQLGEEGVIMQRERCPRLDLAGDARPASLRKRVAYYRRRAEREGCTLVVTPAGEVTEQQLVTLGHLHDQRFSGASVLSDQGIAIQEALRRRQRTDLGPVAVTASVNGRPVGMLWGLWFAGVFAYYQSGWLPEYRSLNLGTVLVDEAIAIARELGAVTFDFLRGAEDYKYRFGAADRVDSTILIPRGLPGSMLQLKARTRAVLRSRRTGVPARS